LITRLQVYGLSINEDFVAGCTMLAAEPSAKAKANTRATATADPSLRSG
jgi:uncharacterized protein YraI